MKVRFLCEENENDDSDSVLVVSNYVDFYMCVGIPFWYAYFFAVNLAVLSGFLIDFALFTFFFTFAENNKRLFSWHIMQ